MIFIAHRCIKLSGRDKIHHICQGDREANNTIHVRSSRNEKTIQNELKSSPFSTLSISFSVNILKLHIKLPLKLLIQVPSPFLNKPPKPILPHSKVKLPLTLKTMQFMVKEFQVTMRGTMVVI